MLEDAERVLNELEVFASEENADAFGNILKNTEQLTLAMTQSLQALEPTLQALPALFKRLDVTMAKVDSLTDEVASLAKSARQTVNFLNSPSGPLQIAAASLEQVQRSVAQLQSSTLPEVNRMIESISNASRAFTATTRLFESAPQSVLFGAPTPRPGPGEPGFSGFAKDITP
jgi:phospholipid/cholesterol/gamma-HCH transport system substrate-binding protein